MRTRKDIHDEFNANLAKIKELQAANEYLQKEDWLLCDDKRWFEEKVETNHIRKRGKIVETKTALIGRIKWKEDFKDEDTNSVVTIERSSVVRINGEWI